MMFLLGLFLGFLLGIASASLCHCSAKREEVYTEMCSEKLNREIEGAV